MANKNWMRRYIMKCGKMGQKGFQIGNINNATETALHVCFSIEKSDAENPNDAKVQIWNLSDKNLKILESKDCIVELRAGYGDTMALVLVGSITSVITTMENADRLTEMTVVDGYVGLRDTVVSISLNGKVNSKDVYQTIANEMGMSIVFAKDLTFKSMPNGFSYVGKAKNALQKIAQYCGHKWSIQNQVLQITLPGRAISSSGYLLSKETGLISIPKRITIENGESESTQTGWEVEYLLNGAIGVNDVVRMESSVARGYFRVHKVTIDGDNLEGDWICTAQLIEIEADAELDIKVSKATESISSSHISVGDKVKVTRTFTENGKKKGYQYNGGTFVCWHDAYDVIQIKDERVVIGIGDRVTAAIHLNDIAKIKE